VAVFLAMATGLTLQLHLITAGENHDHAHCKLCHNLVLLAKTYAILVVSYIIGLPAVFSSGISVFCSINAAHYVPSLGPRSPPGQPQIL
jgi:hypothetical protein